MVIDAGGGGDACVIGERLGYFMKRNGAVGIVCDGAIRDSQGMIDLAPPTFARSVCVRIFGSRGPGAINVPVQCGGVPVNPGDVVIGDRDGVVVVPRADAAGVLALADEHLAGELERVKKIESGESMEEVFAVDTKIAAWSA